MVDAYYFCVGGGVGQLAAIARPVGYRCRADEVPDAIERLLEEFEISRRPDETIQHFLSRHSNESIRAILAGAVVAVAERDTSPGRVPHGVEG
jgi:sulfite reductase (ferredoxin)